MKNHQLKVMLASPGHVPLEDFDDHWLFEPKFDGIRVLALGDRDNHSENYLFSRGLQNVWQRFSEIRITAHWVLDGEIVMFDQDGNPSFDLLQARTISNKFNEAQRKKAVFVAFDVLQSPTHGDLTDKPYYFRREILKLYPEFSDNVQLMPQHHDGPELWDVQMAHNREGVVAKHIDSIYLPGRSTYWLKYKRADTSTCLVTGWDPGQGFRESTFGALHISQLIDGEWVPVGKVGTGFSDADLQRVKNLIDHQQTVLVDVSYQQTTKHGKLRFPVFQRVRDDLSVRHLEHEQQGIK